ncbi:carboxypeptidase-like regulatory domain-containing protein [Arthrobacter sp. I2-34]|uniref:Carboxypeptidase-like regulatory domain-containing protein n=1 Tax=Arthrobacter hankyongi TaxID=2904801 RepID=A0ABS9LDA4_9MICC|nr:carboxypeptidase-like regulatory domain-containing protein [Arthrobacter hankyongi]MCG2624684.1 carboxypeptidase-like regulatory domain-containing protein [Arthrobacter hankyongi]
MTYPFTEVITSHDMSFGGSLKSLNMVQRVLSALAVTALAVATAIAGAMPAHAADALIEGRVIDASGKPIPNIAYFLHGKTPADGFGRTDSQGRFTIPASILSYGYILEFEDALDDNDGRPRGTYAPAWYLNGSTSADATRILVSEPGVVRLKDMVLSTKGVKDFEKAPVPVIGGTVEVGKTIYALSGSWFPELREWSSKYRWFRDGKPIWGNDGMSAYVLSPEDAGRKITVAVSGYERGYRETTRTSFSVIAPRLNYSKVAKPTISGTTTVGKTLRALPNTWAPNSGPFTYQWYRSGVKIAGATSQRYLLTAADTGRTLTVTATGRATGYNPVTTTSGATARIAKGTLASKTPTISGTKKIGRTLTAKVGTWTSGTKFKYQWYRSGKAIKGADSRTYRLTTADRARSIKVRVTGSKTGYTTATRYSSSTSRIR